MLTLAQIKQYLEGIGVFLPDFVLEMLFNSVSTINECLEEHYDENTANLIRLYLMTLMSIPNADRYISSQTAPNGASQSFKFKSYADSWRSTYNLLTAIDKFGCATSLIPPNPTGTANGGIWVGKGGCMCEGEK